MSSLVAYSASAGSGKTFRITREYLKQILRKSNALTGYRSVLAVTFTNKATEEMKARIVNELNELAQGNGQKLREFCAELALENVTLSPEELQQRALNVRNSLLHDYSRFAILTIDKFFQKVLHAFVNDVGLHPNFNLELDSSRVLDEAVDAVMENVEGDEQLRAWLMQLQEQQLRDGKTWNVRDSLYELGREIFQESYQQLSVLLHDKLHSKEFLQQYLQRLAAIKKEVDDEMASIAASARAYMRGHGLTENDFPYKSGGFIGYFRKIAQGDYEPGARVLAALGAPEKWASKSSAGAAAADAYEALNPLLERACDLWSGQSMSYQTSSAILKNVMELGLLADIARQVRSIASDENLLLISDTTALISSLVGDSDVPFIYEKVGSAYRTYMIDEFQDTSVGQWRNFLPLVSSSLSEDGLSMVVGDVKQSIYRWRSGDWRILAHGIDKDLGRFGAVNRRVLDKNFRSLRSVVEFNNEFFRQMSGALQQELNAGFDEKISPGTRAELERVVEDAYAGCAQVPQRSSGEEGFVHVEFVEDGEEQSPAELILERLPQLVAELQDAGYRAGDIAILTRKRDEARRVAQELIRYGRASGNTAHCFDVVSQDSLLLNSSSVVKLCIALMRIAAGQQNEINEAFLRYESKIYVEREEPHDVHRLFAGPLRDEDRNFLAALTLRSLPEAFEAIVQRYELGSLLAELPFLQALHDAVISFSNKKLSDITSFLEWWDRSGNEKPLQSPEGQNAITITTIHKSKGLQYKVVIVPFAAWDLDTRTGSTVWMKPTVAPFSDMPIVPLSYTSQLRKTIFADQHMVEKAQAFVDNINLMYVALTRAEEQLYVFAPLKKAASAGGAKNIGQVAYALFSGLPDGLGFGALSAKKEGEMVWTFGRKIRERHPGEEPDRRQIPLDFYPSQSLIPKLRMRYEARDLFGGEEASERSRGTLRHKIFERINSAEDVEPAVATLWQEGLIKSENQAKELLAEVRQALAQPDVREWFEGGWRVYTEAEILLPASQHEAHYFFRRPDRVMMRGNQVVVVDYKFGKKVGPSHAGQVGAYVSYLRQMGYGEVKGFVWYVALGEVQAV